MEKIEIKYQKPLFTGSIVGIHHGYYLQYPGAFNPVMKYGTKTLFFVSKFDAKLYSKLHNL